MKACVYAICLTVIFYPALNGSFLLSGWLAYWTLPDAAQVLKKHLDSINELQVFSYEVTKQGQLIDKFIKHAPLLRELRQLCAKRSIAVVPTIQWSDSDAIHTCLYSDTNRAAHIADILEVIRTQDYKGITIDYERVKSDDREFFLLFLKELGEQLHKKNLVLYCCLGARVSDTHVLLPYPAKAIKTLQPTAAGPKAIEAVAVSLNPGRGETAKEFKRVLATACDRIYIMAYSEWGKMYQYNPDHVQNNYFMSHASRAWVEAVVKYFSTFIPADKLVLGIPTYGLEFIVETDAQAHELAVTTTYVRSLSYAQAQALAQEHKQKPQTTAGGELSFVYTDPEGKKRYICYLNAACINERIELARTYNLKGVALFKFEAIDNPELWTTLKKYRALKAAV